MKLFRLTIVLSCLALVASFSAYSDDTPKPVDTQVISKYVKQLQQAAEQGDAEAQYNLGLCYANGKGVEQDYGEAVKWYRKAAEHGDAMAQYNLAQCYFFGNGVEQDKAEAVKWYRSRSWGCGGTKQSRRLLCQWRGCQKGPFRGREVVP